MAKVWVEDYEIQALADLIREYKESKEKLLPVEMEAELRALLENAGGGSEESYTKGYNTGVMDGQKIAYDRFWDDFQLNGERKNYGNAFVRAWTDVTFKPKYPIQGYCYYAFSGTQSSVKYTEVNVDIIPTNIAYAFYYNSYVTTIKKITVTEDLVYTGTFQGASALKNITFDGVIGESISFAQSKLLTTESVQSIIDHLADLTGKTAQTVTFHSNVLVTAEQRAQALAKNWNIVGGREE